MIITAPLYRTVRTTYRRTRRTAATIAATLLILLAAATVTVAATVEEDGSGHIGGDGLAVTYCLPWAPCAAEW